MINIVLFGAPGCGKGTQAALLKEQFGIEHVSTGEVIRDHIRRGTELGKAVQACIERGELAPDQLVINMIDVGEETGELDKMLYKVADVFDEEVAVLTDSLMSLMEPLIIICLGGMVGFIVIALFLPLISLIQNLSGG